MQIRHAEPADYGRVIGRVNAWWGGRDMAPMLPRLFFVHFEGTSYVVDSDDGQLAAFLIGFLLETLIGLTAFWFLEVNSLIFIFMMLNYFLSGHMIPLDYISAHMPDSVQTLLRVLPFQYLAYFPATVMLNRYTHEQLFWNLAVGGAWVVGLAVLNRVVFNLGLRRYSAFGG